MHMSPASCLPCLWIVRLVHPYLSFIYIQAIKPAMRAAKTRTQPTSLCNGLARALMRTTIFINIHAAAGSAARQIAASRQVSHRTACGGCLPERVDYRNLIYIIYINMLVEALAAPAGSGRAQYICAYARLFIFNAMSERRRRSSPSLGR